MSKHIETAQLFDNREQEYRTAGWLGMIAIMERIGIESPNIRETPNDIEKHLFHACVLIAKRESSLIEVLQEWLAHKGANEERLASFSNATITTHRGTKLDGDFVNAYDIFTQTDWTRWVEEHSDFGRLIPIAAELADYYGQSVVAQITRNTELSYMLRISRRHIDFYAGLYDPQNAA